MATTGALSNRVAEKIKLSRLESQDDIDGEAEGVDCDKDVVDVTEDHQSQASAGNEAQ